MQSKSVCKMYCWIQCVRHLCNLHSQGFNFNAEFKEYSLISKKVQSHSSMTSKNVQMNQINKPLYKIISKCSLN